MNEQENAALRDRMHAYDVGTLLTILGPERGQYTPAAIGIAEEELRRRRVDDAVIEHLRGFLQRRASAGAEYLMEQVHRLRAEDEAPGPCHLCGRVEIAAFVPFGLARPSDSVSIAEIDAVKLHLRLCSSCLSSRIRISGEDFARHPGLDQAQELGFRHFVSPRELGEVAAVL